MFTLRRDQLFSLGKPSDEAYHSVDQPKIDPKRN